MAKKIVSVGMLLAADEVDHVAFDTKASLSTGTSSFFAQISMISRAMIMV